MRTIAVIVAVLLAAVAAGACGGNAEDDVRSSWEAAARAVADGDATGFCAMVSREGKDEITARTGLACEDAVRLLASQLGAADKAAIRGAAISAVQVDGDAATVTYEAGPGLEQVGFTGRTSMTRVDGRWLLQGI